MPIEYLGNKTRLLDFVLAPIRALEGIISVADVFCGTASVSRALAHAGYRVVAGDHLELCTTLAEAALLNSPEPRFSGLLEEVPRAPHESMHAAVLRRLNSLNPCPGFMHDNYSPASAVDGAGRMYLTTGNAAKIDAIRAEIEKLAPLLTRGERSLLLSDLVRAVSRVSNTAGTYGSYLKRWKHRALEPVALRPSTHATSEPNAHEVHLSEASDLVRTCSADVVYLDPPYTKRQYAAYYHLLETLVSGERPELKGSTGLPPWRRKQSEFCYGVRAAAALRELVHAAQSRHIVLSYSEDGHISHEELLDILATRGSVAFWELPSRRYRSNTLGHRRTVVHERLYHVKVTR